ncbi:hypothetical protein [Brachybacterium sp. FME24]|uniref:hypothetical protein n=1 Tax=Brachybacterium sp. FME24 TaxID=2742605 RepID=UPI00186850D4|nr:hypothetical protein [Brachybacterium sp. FME24]
MCALRRDQILPLAVGTVAAAALGTIPLHRLPRPLQIGYVVAPATLTAIVTHVAQGARDPRHRGDTDADSLTTEPAESAQETAPVTGTVVADEPAGTADEVEAPISTSWRLGLSLGLGALVAGAGVAGIWIDHRVEDALRSRGVPAPRLVMGLGTGVLTAAFAALDTDETEHGTHSGR